MQTCVANITYQITYVYVLLKTVPYTKLYIIYVGVVSTPLIATIESMRGQQQIVAD